MSEHEQSPGSLTEFLLARIAEDEDVARAASPGPWGLDEIADVWDGDYLVARRLSDDDGAHVARHDPARVLAECEAKRRIVELCARVIADDEGMSLYSDGWAGLTVARRTIAALAQPYADHPDYREEWRA